ncbi:hypothetical protein BU25DRAFT_418257 [Macroventuria anomochaeta]|uniref:Uncharacterized protein n=1 Tax=Macroventuria anomochaeta TaxID=301207 RepID=A0ACB6SEE7_9PLEO|nr:uncharacterized protein BU25DRAFT_418257 [Macroventuria anomochaeta]KAF2631462.1 hypothetical protein BU25DRAFT_418257 [Macroventuria anomochaeta]
MRYTLVNRRLECLVERKFAFLTVHLIAIQRTVFGYDNGMLPRHCTKLAPKSKESGLKGGVVFLQLPLIGVIRPQQAALLTSSIDGTNQLRLGARSPEFGNDKKDGGGLAQTTTVETNLLELYDLKGVSDKVIEDETPKSRPGWCAGQIECVAKFLVVLVEFEDRPHISILATLAAVRSS